MADRLVVNESPLIVLSRAGRIDLLTLAGTPIHVPESVGREVRAHSDEAARVLETVSWLHPVPDARMLPLPLARPLVEEFIHAGLYLSEPIVEQALGLVGE